MNNLEKIVVSLKDSRPLVKIGWTGENDARGIVWDISTWQTIYGNGTCTLLNQRETDDAPYPCSITIDGKFAIWKVTDADLGAGGNGKCQLIYQVGEEVVAKSPVYKTLAERSLGGVTIVETPDWVLQVIQAGADAVDAAERAEDAAKKAEDTADGATEAINSAAIAGIQAVNAAGQAAIGAVGSAVAAVNDAKNAGVQAVKDAQTAAINAVSEAQTQATEAVGTAKTQAVQAVEDAENTGVSAVEDAKSNALTEVGEAKTTAVDAVNAVGTQATSAVKTAITAAKNQAVSDVQTVGQAAVSSVGDAQIEAVEAVETSQTNAVQAVQDAGADEVEKINGILPVPTAEDVGKVPIAKPDGSGYELGSQIDDAQTAETTTWSSQNIVSRLCLPFTTEGSIVTCQPVEGSRLNTVVQIEPVQEGTGDPSPENIRPIQGWDSATIWHGGKNLLGEDLPALDGFIDNASDAIVSSTSQGKTYVVPIKKYGTFTVSVNKTQIIRLATCAFKPYLGASLSTITTATSTYRSITSNSSDRYLLVNLPRVDFGADEPMLVYGDELSYEPYCGKMIEIPFGQTVYGGTLDVESGVLTVNDATLVLDGLKNKVTAGSLAISEGYAYLFRVSNYAHIQDFVGICSHYRHMPIGGSLSIRVPGVLVSTGTYGGGDIYLISDINNSEQMNAYLSAQNSAGTPVQIVYKLGEPIIIQLTPQEIRALSGVNTVYADAGDVAVSGYSDPTTIIKNLADRIATLEAAATNL